MGSRSNNKLVENNQFLQRVSPCTLHINDFQNVFLTDEQGQTGGDWITMNCVSSLKFTISHASEGVYGWATAGYCGDPCLANIDCNLTLDNMDYVYQETWD